MENKKIEKEKGKKTLKEIASWIIIIAIIILIRQYVVAIIRVNGSSMEKTLYDKDVMILDKISYKFNKLDRFDIVVIKKGKDYLIKRVIGLPGETVEYKDNVLYIDGKKIDENFSHEITDNFKINKVSEDSYFVLGDNRTNSLDSRVLGAISIDDIIGKTSLTIYPFDRIGNKK